jgi:hypothetical protein
VFNLDEYHKIKNKKSAQTVMSHHRTRALPLLALADAACTDTQVDAGMGRHGLALAHDQATKQQSLRHTLEASKSTSKISCCFVVDFGRCAAAGTYK